MLVLRSHREGSRSFALELFTEPLAAVSVATEN